MKKVIIALLLLLFAMAGCVFYAAKMYTIQHDTTSSTITTATNAKQPVTMDLDSARNIAFQDAGITEADWIEQKLDADDGRLKYELEFYVDSNHYEYEIDAVTGDILEKEISQSAVPAHTDAIVYINESQALRIALAHVGFSEEEVQVRELELDTEDGVTVYDIEITHEQSLFLYKIDAETGEILGHGRNID